MFKDRASALAAGERYYFPETPCKHGHISKRTVASYSCAKCASEASLRCEAKRPWHPARLAAKEAGLKTYQTGEPCKNGHAAPRFTCNGICVECDAAKHKRWHTARPGVEAKWARERRAEDPTGHREASKRWYHSNKDAAKAICKAWKAANPERMKVHAIAGTNNRRARKLANGGSFTAADIETIFERQGGKCSACSSSDRLEIDHVLPIVLGGSSDPSNLQLLCLPCNRSKGSKHPDDWLKQV